MVGPSVHFRAGAAIKHKSPPSFIGCFGEEHKVQAPWDAHSYVTGFSSIKHLSNQWASLYMRTNKLPLSFLDICRHRSFNSVYRAQTHFNYISTNATTVSKCDSAAPVLSKITTASSVAVSSVL